MVAQPGTSIVARAVPKAEIHLHLEGSIALETLRELLRRRGEPADEGAGRRLAALYRHRDFPHFLSNFRDLCSHLTSPADFALVTAALCARLREDGVRYAEVFCSPQIFVRSRGLPPAEILDAVSREARDQARRGGPRLRFLLDGVRQFGVGGLEELVEIAAGCRAFDVIGIGVGGDEKALPTSAFAGVFREARRRGLHTTVHAGEFAGASSVRQALEALEAERIGHGIRALEDPSLVEALARAGIPLECCPTSNIRTGVVRDWDAHPMRALKLAGVAVTVNSDDPALFGSSLAEEWTVLSARLGFTEAEVLEIGIATVRASFLPGGEKAALVAEMRREGARAGVTA